MIKNREPIIIKNRKHFIAEQIAYESNDSYEYLLEIIYNNQYRKLLKVPITTFIMGIIGLFQIRDINHANNILKDIKEVVQEALEISGIELTFVDSDWDDLKIIENQEGRWKESKPYLLSNNEPFMSEPGKPKPKIKHYMGEFFEN